MNAIDQYFHVVPFITLYKFVLALYQGMLSLGVGIQITAIESTTAYIQVLPLTRDCI